MSPAPSAAGAWVSGATISVSEAGMITHIAAPGDAPPAGMPPAGLPPAGAAEPSHVERVAGIVIPGMPNGHSHAFQRAMAGSAEYRSAANDSFWTWREAMYALANRIEPDELRLIATQLFVEMLKAGYTAVAEFHYLHRAADGSASLTSNALWEAIGDAAHEAGIGLTLLPTLYQASDFGAKPLKREQARFRLSDDEFLRAVANRIEAERRASTEARGGARRTGVAFHSLRAVPLATLDEIARALRSIDAQMPVHIHVAEQRREVRACQRETGRRPIELLLGTGLVNRHWCLVHATHATPAELRGIGASGAAVCVSITTEANLGDGYFDTVRFLNGGGILCVGSDSQSTVSPAEELRWLEYQQRLRRQRRAVLATPAEGHAGTRLWTDAALAGAQALGQPIGALAVGRRADFLVLDPDHPALAAAGPAAAFDHLIFAGGEAAIRDVMVAGHWVVRDRCHAADEKFRVSFAALMRRFATT